MRFAGLAVDAEDISRFATTTFYTGIQLLKQEHSWAPNARYASIRYQYVLVDIRSARNARSPFVVGSR